MRTGFTLIELMIVVAIIAIIAAIAIPNMLETKKAANEAHTVAALKSYCTAQTTYKTNNYSYAANGNSDAWAKCYARSYQNLGGANAHLKSDGSAVDLIPAVFGNAFEIVNAYQGYFYCDIPNDSNGAFYGDSNWKFGHSLSAIPAVWDKSGTHTFAIGVEGTVYMKDFGMQGFGAQVPNMPNPSADPTWVAP